MTRAASPLSPRFARWLARVVLAWAVLAVCLLPGTTLRPPTPVDTNAPPVVDVPVERHGKLLIRVTAGDAPVADAQVRALYTTDEGSVLVETATTDATGNASLAHLPRGVHWIVVDAPGRARAGTSVAIEDEAESAPAREVAVALAPEHMLDVRVKDESGAAVAGAEVEALGAGPLPSSAITDGAGLAHVTRLGAGPFAVTARASGLEEVTRTGVPENAVAEIVLRKLGALVVHVEGPGGAKASGARVEIAGAALGTSREARADDSGNVRIASLAAGAYALRATLGGKVSATELDVRLASGEERAITLRLEPGVFVAARALGEEPTGNVPLAGAAIVVAEEGLSPFPLEGVTDREGRARLGPIARGPAAVSASAPGYVSRDGVPISPVDASGVASAELVLPRAGVVEGRVVDARGFPIGGVTLVVVGTDRNGGPIDEDPRRARVRDTLFAASLAGPAPLLARGELGVVPGPVPAIPRAVPSSLVAALPAARQGPPPEPWITRDDGTFRITPVPPGRVRVLARHPQYVEGASDIVALEPAGRAEVNLVLAEGGVLEGTVVDARGRNQPGVRVTALATHGMLERSVRTGDDGRFAFASLPSAVTLLVEGDGGRSARMPVEVKDGDRREVRIVLPEPREPVDVRVRDDRDDPLDAVQLSIGSLDPTMPLRTTVFTDRNGEARIPNVRGLPIRILASHPGHAPKSITVDGDAPTLAIVLDRGRALVGEVRGRRVGALDGAEIVVASDSGTVRTNSNARGEFRLEGLPPTRVRLSVRAKGHAPVERNVVVDSGRVDRPFDVGRIELAEECAVEGEVVDESGAPVAGARVGRDHVPTWVPATGLPPGLALSDARGAFHLGELAEGTIALEAYAADRGRGRAEGVRVSPGRPTTGIRIVLGRAGAAAVAESAASGNVAVTLGTTEDGAIVLADVVVGTAAERAGLVEGDRIVSVDGAPVHTMDEARAKLAGPVQDDVVIVVQRGDKNVALRVPREAARR